MQSQFREIIRQKIVDVLAAPPPALTRRDGRLPAGPARRSSSSACGAPARRRFSGNCWRIVWPREPAGKGFCISASKQIDLFRLGSSARLLSREVAIGMRGRAVEDVVYPFIFREHRRHQRWPRVLPLASGLLLLASCLLPPASCFANSHD